MKNFHFSEPACLAAPKENSKKGHSDTAQKGGQCYTIFMQDHNQGSARLVRKKHKCSACIKREEFI